MQPACHQARIKSISEWKFANMPKQKYKLTVRPFNKNIYCQRVRKSFFLVHSNWTHFSWSTRVRWVYFFLCHKNDLDLRFSVRVEGIGSTFSPGPHKWVGSILSMWVVNICFWSTWRSWIYFVLRHMKELDLFCPDTHEGAGFILFWSFWVACVFFWSTWMNWTYFVPIHQISGIYFFLINVSELDLSTWMSWI